ncbi:MAG: hypothetical protein WDN08_02670 [Rhizomicrobium sp.]
MNLKVLTASALILGLAACATPTPYQPAQNDTGPGYTDQQLGNNRYRITFTGNSQTQRQTVENYLMLRAAEVTQKAGFTYFAFDDRDTEAKTSYRTLFTGFSGWGPGWGPGFGWYHRNWLYDPWDPYWSHDSTVTVPSTRYQAYAEIVLLTPDQAQGDPHAVNAADVIARLGPAAAASNAPPGSPPPAPAH